MLPSMPILFPRESQDAFGNKIEPSTSFFNQHSSPKPAIVTQATAVKPDPGPSVVQEAKAKPNTKKKEEPPKPNNNALQEALVKSYYTKIQSRFNSNSQPDNKFVQFREMLKTFDPTKETPVDLYNRVEQLFGEEHKDIVEEFLLFLKPGQAAQVGRLMDQLMQAQITSFIELLQKTFSRKPTVLRKVVRALVAGANAGGADLRAKVLPHLRSNARLAQMFRALFPDDRPPDSAYATGTDVIDESFLTGDRGYDVWEYDPPDPPDQPNQPNQPNRPAEPKGGLDAVYLHGRVFLQHGRMLRTACVTYPYSKEPYRAHSRGLAPHCRLSSPDSDEERSSPKRATRNTSKIPPKRTRKQIKTPKQVKDVNDNTKHKSCQALNNPKTVKCKPKARNHKKDAEAVKNRKEKVCSKKTEAKVQPVTEVKTESPKESRSWTREEDKTMLEVLKGEVVSELMFQRISERLPQRSAAEIKERFCYVMNLLQQMDVIKVT